MKASIKVVKVSDLPSTFLKGFKQPILNDAWKSWKEMGVDEAVVIQCVSKDELSKFSDSLRHRRVNGNIPEMRISIYTRDLKIVMRKMKPRRK